MLAGASTVYVCSAQKTSYGFTIGTAISNYTSKVDGVKQTEKSVAGLTAGVLLEIPAGENFSIQPAVNFVQKGTRDEQNSEKVKLSVNCIEVPLSFLYTATGSTGIFLSGQGRHLPLMFQANLNMMMAPILQMKKLR